MKGYVASRFTARPVEVEALQFDGKADSVRPFVDEIMLPGVTRADPFNPDVPTILVATSRNNAEVPYSRAWPGDWIVRTPAGFELYGDVEFRRRFLPTEG